MGGRVLGILYARATGSDMLVWIVGYDWYPTMNASHTASHGNLVNDVDY
jgi:hypothetical protein